MDLTSCFVMQKLNPAISQYRDRRFNGTQEEFEECLKKSTTLYVGNLSFYTTEEQIFEVITDAIAIIQAFWSPIRTRGALHVGPSLVL